MNPLASASRPRGSGFGSRNRKPRNRCLAKLYSRRLFSFDGCYGQNTGRRSLLAEACTVASGKVQMQKNPLISLDALARSVGRVLIVALGAIVASAAHAEARVTWQADIIRLEARDAPVSEVLMALGATYELRSDLGSASHRDLCGVGARGNFARTRGLRLCRGKLGWQTCSNYLRDEQPNAERSDSDGGRAECRTK